MINLKSIDKNGNKRKERNKHARNEKCAKPTDSFHVDEGFFFFKKKNMKQIWFLMMHHQLF